MLRGHVGDPADSLRASAMNTAMVPRAWISDAVRAAARERRGGGHAGGVTRIEAFLPDGSQLCLAEHGFDRRRRASSLRSRRRNSDAGAVGGLASQPAARAPPCRTQCGSKAAEVT